MKRILIFANGNLPDLERARAILHPADAILCADGGTRHALALGLRPDLVIGDMDSLTRPEWSELEKAGIAIELYPHDKDETDLELAVTRALEMEPASLVIIGALGLRLDHTLANLSLLSDPRLAGLDARIDDGVEEVQFCRAEAELAGAPDDLVSLIPWGGPALGVRTAGLRWPLNGETLHPEKTRGISNKMLDASARISLASGLLLVIHRRQS